MTVLPQPAMALASRPGVLRRAFGRIAAPFGGTIIGVKTREPLVALTFDDGPDPIWTPRLLHLLEARQARATFFMIGSRAQQNPELVARVAAGGHAIANHSWDHASFPRLSRLERQRQLDLCSRALGAHASRIFRPPYGHQNGASRFDLWRAGYQVVTWDVVEPDWTDAGAESIAAGILARLHPGAIVLLHDSLFDHEQAVRADRTATVEAVRVILDEASERFRFVPLPELLRAGRPKKTLWLSEPDESFFARRRRNETPVRGYAKRELS